MRMHDDDDNDDNDYCMPLGLYPPRHNYIAATTKTRNRRREGDNQTMLSTFGGRICLLYVRPTSNYNHERLSTFACYSSQAEMSAAVAMKQLCVRGYHVYKDVWAAVVGEELVYRKRKFPWSLCCVSNKKIVSSLATCPGKYRPLLHCSLWKMEWSCVESWEEDTSVECWCARVSKCLEYFCSFKFSDC